MIIYNNLFRLMEKQQIDPYDLVRNSLITRQTLKRLENNQNVTLYTLEVISDYLKCSIWDLFSFQ